MLLKDAIQQLQSMIHAAGNNAQIKVVIVSEEEARISVYAPALEVQAIKDATFQATIDILNTDGLDVQVFVYDKDAPPLKG